DIAPTQILPPAGTGDAGFIESEARFRVLLLKNEEPTRPVVRNRVRDDIAVIIDWLSFGIDTPAYGIGRRQLKAHECHIRDQRALKSGIAFTLLGRCSGGPSSPCWCCGARGSGVIPFTLHHVGCRSRVTLNELSTDHHHDLAVCRIRVWICGSSTQPSGG